jgi:hypothetical protein
MSYRRFMTRCVVCVVCVRELDHADSQPTGRKIFCYELLDKSLVVCTN